MRFSTTITRLGVLLGLGTLLGSVAMAQQTKPVLLAPNFTPQNANPGRDRFLDVPVLTTDALVEVLKTNKTFRKNIAKHFNLAEDRMIAFAKDALVPYVLSKNTPVTNFGVTKAGVIYGKKTILPKGTRVWATRSGDPILKWNCSNPITVRVPVLNPPPTETKVSFQVKPDVKQVAMREIAPAGLEGRPGGQIAFLDPNEPPVELIKEPLKGTGTNTTVPSSTPSRSFARACLPLLPLAGVVGVVVRSVPQPVGTIDPEADQTQTPLPARTPALSRSHTVPEPGSILLTGLGLLGLPLLRRRK